VVVLAGATNAADDAANEGEDTRQDQRHEHKEQQWVGALDDVSVALALATADNLVEKGGNGDGHVGHLAAVRLDDQVDAVVGGQTGAALHLQRVVLLKGRLQTVEGIDQRVADVDGVLVLQQTVGVLEDVYDVADVAQEGGLSGTSSLEGQQDGGSQGEQTKHWKAGHVGQ